MALLADIGLGWNSLAGTNTLSYSSLTSATKEKVWNIDTSMESLIQVTKLQNFFATYLQFKILKFVPDKDFHASLIFAFWAGFYFSAPLGWEAPSPNIKY
jgi:hypothetical protein